MPNTLWLDPRLPGLMDSGLARLTEVALFLSGSDLTGCDLAMGLAGPDLLGPQADWSDHELVLIRLTCRFLAPAGLALADLSRPDWFWPVWHDQTHACSWFWPRQAWLLTVDCYHGCPRLNLAGLGPTLFGPWPDVVVPDGALALVGPG